MGNIYIFLPFVPLDSENSISHQIMTFLRVSGGQVWIELKIYIHVKDMSVLPDDSHYIKCCFIDAGFRLTQAWLHPILPYTVRDILIINLVKSRAEDCWFPRLDGCRNKPQVTGGFVSKSPHGSCSSSSGSQIKFPWLRVMGTVQMFID